MQSEKIRIIVEYKESVLISLPQALKGDDLIRKVMKKMGINLDTWEVFEFHHKYLKSKVNNEKDHREAIS